MNPLTNVKNIQKLNQRELELGLTNKKSWHDQYKDSAWIFVGGLPYDLTEGDIVCVFSQYGEIVNINLVREKKTGKSKGFCFICFEDQRSTVLTVDNLNSIKLLGRTIRVDHVEEYKQPKEHGDEDEVTLKLRKEGCAPEVPKAEVIVEESVPVKVKKEKKVKKQKKKTQYSSSDGSISDNSDKERSVNNTDKVKVNKTHSSEYDRATTSDGSSKMRRSDGQARPKSLGTSSDTYPERLPERMFDRERNRNWNNREDDGFMEMREVSHEPNRRNEFTNRDARGVRREDNRYFSRDRSFDDKNVRESRRQNDRGSNNRERDTESNKRNDRTERDYYKKALTGRQSYSDRDYDRRFRKN